MLGVSGDGIHILKQSLIKVRQYDTIKALRGGNDISDIIKKRTFYSKYED